VFGVGLTEIAVIAFVAVLVFGPDKLPDLARQAAQFFKIAGKMAREARDELRTELGPEYSDLELRDLDPRSIVRKHISEAMKDIDLDDDDEDEIGARRRQREQRELAEGELPPYDAEAT
jgi:sec-independent protein translocase protein TatB